VIPDPDGAADELRARLRFETLLTDLSARFENCTPITVVAAAVARAKASGLSPLS